MVFLLEVIELVETVVDGIHLCGVEVDALQMAAHLLGDVLEFDVTAVDALLEFCCGRVDLTDLAQFVERGAQGRDDARLFGRQGVVGFVERTLDVF